MLDKVREAVEKYDMIKKGDTVCVGLSGGADSTALLLALTELKAELGIKELEAIHINHKLRGEESDGDERFCRDLCGKLAVPFNVTAVNVTEYAKENRLCTEEAARILRYSAFEKAGARKICTAHTLNDSAETLLFNLCRGTGLKGLAGIPPVRDKKIIRPLILCARKDVLDYLAGKGQDYVTDSSNFSDGYSRNKIRNKAIPVLEEINNGFFGNIERLTEIIALENDYLDSQAKHFSNSDLRNVHPAVRRRVIKKTLEEKLLRDVSHETVAAVERLVLSGGKGKTNVRKNVYAVVSGGFLNIVDCDTVYKFNGVIFEPVLIKIGENAFLSDKIVTVNVNINENISQNENVHKNLTNNALDYDKIKGDVFLRNRREGDKFIREGRDFHSSLKKLFNENVPRARRDYVPVLCDEEGIIWVEGFGIAGRVKPDKNTKRVMTLEVSQCPEE